MEQFCNILGLVLGEMTEFFIPVLIFIMFSSIIFNSLSPLYLLHNGRVMFIHLTIFMFNHPDHIIHFKEILVWSIVDYSNL